MRDAHLHVRLEQQLLEQMKAYAHRTGKTLSQIVLDHFRYLLSMEKVQRGMVKALEETKRMPHVSRTRASR